MTTATTGQSIDNLVRILSTVTDGIVVVDEHGVVLFANESAGRIFGDRPLLGKNLGIPLAPFGRHQDIQVVHKGQVGWAELRAAPIDWDGGAAMIGSFRDITARKKAEDAMRRLTAELEERVHQRTIELENANKELESFSYSVSHDLRAPLRAIDGFARIVELKYAERLDAEGQRLISMIRDSTRRMGELINDLLSFSRMARVDMLLQPLDMNDMIKSLIEEVRAAEPERKIEFIVSPVPRARGDAAMLRHVWFNLLSNAVKFTRRCDAAHIEIGGRDDGSETLFWIKDDGDGFNMRYADKLFGVFQRLHRQTEFEGTGVGLAIAKRILQRHGGRIWGEGKPQAGATFWFTLPAISQAPQVLDGGSAT